MPQADLSPVIAATAQWLVRAYPTTGGTFRSVVAEMQARQAVKVAAWLRYPTLTDAALLVMVGPGGSARLDWAAGSDPAEHSEAEYAWRTWVDEVVASWAACLLAEPTLATTAVNALRGCEHTRGLRCDFARLTAPGDSEIQSTALLRHPDLLAPIADLHRAALLDRLRRGALTDTVDAA